MIYINSKNGKNPPTPQDIKKRIRENKQEEKKIAKEKGTLTNHFRKWDNFHE